MKRSFQLHFIFRLVSRFVKSKMKNYHFYKNFRVSGFCEISSKISLVVDPYEEVEKLLIAWRLWLHIIRVNFWIWSWWARRSKFKFTTFQFSKSLLSIFELFYVQNLNFLFSRAIIRYQLMKDFQGLLFQFSTVHSLPSPPLQQKIKI